MRNGGKVWIKPKTAAISAIMYGAGMNSSTTILAFQHGFSLAGVTHAKTCRGIAFLAIRAQGIGISTLLINSHTAIVCCSPLK